MTPLRWDHIAADSDFGESPLWRARIIERPVSTPVANVGRCGTPDESAGHACSPPYPSMISGYNDACCCRADKWKLASLALMCPPAAEASVSHTNQHPMACQQCGRPAIIGIGPNNALHLCVDCWGKVQAIHSRQMEDHERLLNFASAEFDMAAGLPGFTPKFPPRPRPVVVTGNTVLNNIKIANSQIGVVNTPRWTPQIRPLIDTSKPATTPTG